MGGKTQFGKFTNRLADGKPNLRVGDKSFMKMSNTPNHDTRSVSVASTPRVSKAMSPNNTTRVNHNYTQSDEYAMRTKIRENINHITQLPKIKRQLPELLEEWDTQKKTRGDMLGKAGADEARKRLLIKKLKRDKIMKKNIIK